MWLSELALVNFRNYERLALRLDPGVAVFCGRNGQGKTNLLEAVHVLATTRSPRTNVEGELVRRQQTSPLGTELDGAHLPAFARIDGRARGGPAEARIEMLFKVGDPTRERLVADEKESSSRVQREIRVNGLATRAAGLIGSLRVVYFAPEDVALVAGPPAGRRRHLDITISQVHPLYLGALQQFNRILLQRNQVLRQVRERRTSPASVEPWTEQMVRTGVFLLQQRAPLLAATSARAEGIFRDLSGLSQQLRVVYRSPLLEEGEVHVDAEELARRYRARQAELTRREVELAVSLVGPHRDDFTFLLDDVDLNVYGSRGEQRLAVLALKLAEADWMRAETDDLPVVLLDDLLSELDPERREYVLHRLAPRGQDDTAEGRQVWITTTDVTSFPSTFLTAAQHFNVDAGTVRRA